VPDVTNFYSAALVEPSWALRLGASSLPSVSFLGTSVPAAGPSAAPLAKAGSPALPRVRGKVAVLVPQAQQVGGAPLGGQTNIHNYMTDIFTVGEGASGPPRDRGPV
jgi:hypothetical protein